MKNTVQYYNYQPTLVLGQSETKKSELTASRQNRKNSLTFSSHFCQCQSAHQEMVFNFHPSFLSSINAEIHVAPARRRSYEFHTRGLPE